MPPGWKAPGMLRNWLAHRQSGPRELAALAVLYAAYEIVRGVGGEDFAAARANTEWIVELERQVGVYVERAVQEAVHGVAGLPSLLGLAYMLLHFAGTAAFLVWAHRRNPRVYATARTTLVVSTALALVGYVLFPAAPPRLAELGFVDTVSSSTGVNLSSDLLGSLYNPLAAVPSLHFGYAVIVGAGLAVGARSTAVRAAGALYPALVLFVIVATGNHFLFDAAAGGAVVLAAWLTARRLEAASRSDAGESAAAPRAVTG
jgi:hypothetical protein